MYIYYWRRNKVAFYTINTTFYSNMVPTILSSLPAPSRGCLSAPFSLSVSSIACPPISHGTTPCTPPLLHTKTWHPGMKECSLPHGQDLLLFLEMKLFKILYVWCKTLKNASNSYYTKTKLTNKSHFLYKSLFSNTHLFQWKCNSFIIYLFEVSFQQLMPFSYQLIFPKQIIVRGTSP